VKLALKSLLIAFLLTTLIITPEVFLIVGSPDKIVGNALSPQNSLPFSPRDRTFLNQTFDGETNGTLPANWTTLNPQYGSILVNTPGINGKGKCAMVLDNSTIGNPSPYRLFQIQTNTIGISFAIKVNSNDSLVQVFLDDGNFGGGANIIFRDGEIGYSPGNGSFRVLRYSYVVDRWYNITMVLNIPSNMYNIYIDSHLEAVNAKFFGSCTQLLRLIFDETGGADGSLLPVAYIDEIWGRQGIEIPREFPTIQKGIDAANDSDIVVVSANRVYYERLTIDKSIWLFGEDLRTTVIDLSLATPKSSANGVSIKADGIRMTGFTIRSTQYSAGILVEGSNNIIEYDIITNGLGDGVDIVGSDNFITGNVITSNSMYGVNISGSGNALMNNTIMFNDAGGILLAGSSSAIEDNSIDSNFNCGIWMTEGDNSLVRNNTIRKNALGIKCDAATADNRIFQNRFIDNDQEPQAVDNGFNDWDDGYPYLPSNKTGGGNYWSDLESVDKYFGADQKQQLCFPVPDGISDTPYALSPRTQDTYPISVIQNITDSTTTAVGGSPCASHSIEYGKGITVTATFLRNVTISTATIFVEYWLESNSSAHSYENATMGISDPGNNIWTGTIPPKNYSMLVTYNVSAQAQLDTIVNSTNYPLSGPFSVVDNTAPFIGPGNWTPYSPDNESLIQVWAIVSEPSGASGLAKVSLSYLFGNTVWTADMVKTSDDNFTALMPMQPGGKAVLYNITAVDKAGNRAVNGTGAGIPIVFVPVLSVNNTVINQEPCDIDLGVMYRGEKKSDNRLTLANIGGENMAWSIVTINGGDWLKSIVPSSGVLSPLVRAPNNSLRVNLTVDTASLDPNLYVTELTVVANGSVPRWVVLLRFIVRDIAIDASWCSKPAPTRSNINENVAFAFHAEWTHNCSDATYGNISVGGYGPVTVNGTGWANINNFNLSSAGSKTFWVLAVDFIYVKDNQTYHIRSFTQIAENLTAIWDRVKVVLKLADDRIDVNSNASIIWDSSVYESDNSKFEGSVQFNDTLAKATVGRYAFAAISVNDTKYNLTSFQSNTVFCIYDNFKINVGGVSEKTTNVGKPETVWVMALYEYDNMVFKGGNGTLYIDVYVLMFDGNTQRWTWVWNRTDPMDFSSLYDRWEKTYSFDDAGPRRFVVSKLHPIEDRLYNLTAFNDLVVPPLTVTWFGGGWATWPDPLPSLNTDNSSNTQPVPIQGSMEFPFWAVTAIIITLAIGLFLIFALILASGKQRNHKLINGKMKDKHLK
jgi:parallel beta-helix repeat protein